MRWPRSWRTGSNGSQVRTLRTSTGISPCTTRTTRCPHFRPTRPTPSGCGSEPSAACTGSPEAPDGCPTAAHHGPPSSSPVRPGRRRSRPGTSWPPTGVWLPTPGRPPRTSRCGKTPCRSERHNRLHPGSDRRVPLVTESLADGAGPIVAVTDFMRAVPDQVARWVPRPFTSLGTDGFGRSDTREVLRRFFEVDAAHVVVSRPGRAWPSRGRCPTSVVAEAAIGRYGIDRRARRPLVVLSNAVPVVGSQRPAEPARPGRSRLAFVRAVAHR